MTKATLQLVQQRQLLQLKRHDFALWTRVINGVLAQSEAMYRLAAKLRNPNPRQTLCATCGLDWQRCGHADRTTPPATPKPAPQLKAPTLPTATVDEAGKATLWDIVQALIEAGDLPAPGDQVQVARLGRQPVSLVRRPHQEAIFIYCIGYDSHPVAFWGRDWHAQSSAYKGKWKVADQAQESFDSWWERLTGPRKRSRFQPRQGGGWERR
jgi:hypothetical protein